MILRQTLIGHRISFRQAQRGTGIRRSVMACIAFAGAALGFINAPIARATPLTFVSIVAHPDDDFYFMDPDITNSILQGNNQVLVYLTGGNVMTDDYYYMHEREQGSREVMAARALMVRALQAANATPGVTPNINWKNISNAVRPDTVHWTIRQKIYGLARVTQSDCVEFPSLHIIHLHLPASEQIDGTNIQYSLISPTGAGPIKPLLNLRDLYNVANASQAGMDHATTYTKASLTDTLTAILVAYSPQAVRMQDWVAPNDFVNPSLQSVQPPCDQSNGGVCVHYAVENYQGSGHYFDYDHNDHYWGAWFAHDAVAQYINATGANPTLYEYRGYNIEFDDVTQPSYLLPDFASMKYILSYAYSPYDFHFSLDSGLINGLYVYAKTAHGVDGTTRYEYPGGHYGIDAWITSQTASGSFVSPWTHEGRMQLPFP